jgi:uncharacterized FlaG/YvyC family protein
MTKLEMNQDEIKNAINAIQEFIHLIVNGLEIVQDDQGISSVRIIDHESKKLVRELEPEELLAVVDNCKTLMSLTQRTL